MNTTASPPDGATAPLRVPHVTAKTPRLNAALAYAEAGFYVLPCKRGTKHPGSLLGNGWPTKSSRDRAVIERWWGQWPDAEIALHAGRSGLVVFDVDAPGKVPKELREHLVSAPFQSTRTNVKQRGHHLFRQPPGRMIGNGTGALGDAWGQVRGANGVIIATPSTHEKANQGGRYRWSTRRPDVVPVLPADLADALADSTDREAVLPDADIEVFLDSYAGTDPAGVGWRPGALDGPVEWYRSATEDQGAGRHDSMVEAACWALREARAGAYPARAAVSALRTAWEGSFRGPSVAGRRRRPGRDEYGGIVAWAAAQALASDPAETRARMDRNGAGNGDEDEEVVRELRRMRVRERARIELEAEGWKPPPTFGSLADQLADPLPENGWIVKELAGTGMTVLFIAQWKAGKTVLGFNLSADLADGAPFLGQYQTALTDGTTVAYWNFELDGRRAQDWLSALSPARPERLHVEHWRGYPVLPIETPRGEDWCVNYLTERRVSVLIVDPLSGAHDHEENANLEMGRWFKALERIKRRAGGLIHKC